MPLPAEIRDFYTQAGPMTALGAHRAAVEAAPRGLETACQTVQGVLVHHHWAQAYQVEMTPRRAEQQHLRTAAATFDRVMANADRPLAERREASDRAVGVCRHFSVLATAILRQQGVPARCRVGFGAYFNPGTFEDHWVVEYWNDTEDRWVLTDAQIDALQAGALKIDFDPKDTPRDRFIIAGDAWRACRAGRSDPMTYGIFDMRGYWFIAGNVVRDLASLNNMEMLPWDAWGATPVPDAPMSEADFTRIDRVAELTLDADRRFAELRSTYETDPDLKVPAEVLNVLTNRTELVLSEPAGA